MRNSNYDAVENGYIDQEYAGIDFEPAGFWIRLLSRLMDNLILGVVFFILFILFFGFDAKLGSQETILSGVIIGALLLNVITIGYLPLVLVTLPVVYFVYLDALFVPDGGQPFYAKMILFVLLTLIIYIAYYVILNMRGATLGKMATGIEIADEQTGERLTFGQALGRLFAMEFLSGSILGLGYMWAGWHPKKQTWHDTLAHTIVAYDINIIPPPLPPPVRELGPAFGEVIFVGGRMNGKHFTLHGKRVQFGRNVEDGIQIKDPDRKVSRVQCEIYKVKERYYVRNLSSARTTYLNGRKLDNEINLRDNDIISFFDYKMKIKFFN